MKNGKEKSESKKRTLLVMLFIAMLGFLLTPNKGHCQFNVSDVKKIKRKVEDKSDHSQNNKRKDSEDNNNAQGKESNSRDGMSTSNQNNKMGEEGDDWQFVRQQSVLYRKLYETSNETRMSSRSNSNPIPVRGKEYGDIAKGFPKQKIVNP